MKTFTKLLRDMKTSYLPSSTTLITTVVFHRILSNKPSFSLNK